MVVKLRSSRPMVVCYPPNDVPMVEDPDNPGQMIPDDTWLITQDDTPVDGQYTEKEMRLLTNPLYANWKGPDGDGAYVAMANVGLFFSATEPPLVPDIMLSVRVHSPPFIKGKLFQAYYLWRYKKMPDVVIEVVSNKKGGEDTRKLKKYAQIGVPWYVIFDPHLYLSDEILRIYQLHGGKFRRTKKSFFPDVGLGLALWEGKFEDRQTDRWLRWCDKKGALIPTAEETAHAERLHVKQEKQRVKQEKQRAEQEKQRAEQEKQRAEQEKQRAEQEKQRAEQEKRRADKLAAKLRALGIDADADGD
jgi:hypothetical protein